MTTKMNDKPLRPLPENFDPGEELWERLVEDIAEGGTPCLETVENLVHQACHMDPNPGKNTDPDQSGEG